MALPPQALEKLIQEPAATQGAYKEFLIFTAGLLILMLVLYFGLSYGYSAWLRGQITSLQGQIKTYAQKTPADQQVKAANFYSQLTNLKQLLQNHSGATPALAILERTASPDIYYTKLSLNQSLGTMDLTGNARTLDAAAAEAAVLTAQPGVDRVNLTNVSQPQPGVWQFSMTAYLKSDSLKLANQIALPPAQTSGGSPSASTTASSTHP